MQKPVTRKANFILGPKSSVPNNAEAVAYWIYISDRVIGRTVDDRIDTFSLPVTVPREAMNVLNVCKSNYNFIFTRYICQYENVAKL